MSAESLRQMVAECTTDPTLQSDVEPSSLNEKEVARAFGRPLPNSLATWWQAVQSANLFIDHEYGQWGLVVWPVVEDSARNQALRDQGRDDLLESDTAVGEFLGDGDLLMVRTDPDADDFGSVWVVTPIDPRDEWETVAPSLADFIQRFVEGGGRKYWES